MYPHFTDEEPEAQRGEVLCGRPPWERVAEALASAPASLPSFQYDFSSLCLQNSSHVDRRSMPSMGYMTHTVSAPSLHGKSVSKPSSPLLGERHETACKGLISSVFP